MSKEEQQSQPVMMRDVWFSTSRRLAMRLEAEQAAPPPRILAFQAAVRPGGSLVGMPISGALTDAVGIVSIELLNPYLPLLLVMLDADRLDKRGRRLARHGRE